MKIALHTSDWHIFLADLIHGAISQSGNALTPWSVAPGDEGTIHAKKLASLLNCPTSPSSEMVECLRKVEPYDIIALDKAFMVMT